MPRTLSTRNLSDDGLRKRLKRYFTKNFLIDEMKISVEVFNGKVYLGGFVNTLAEKYAAESVAWSVSGVRNVISTIEVLAPKSKCDIHIAGDILLSFSYSLGLDLSKVLVTVNNGVVRLTGLVPSQHLKSAAEKQARSSPNVIDVVNELRVLQQPHMRKICV